MEVVTPRLWIRDIVTADLEPLVALWADPTVRRWMAGWGPWGRGEVVRWVQCAVESNQATPRFAHNCVIVERATSEVLGWIGFGKADDHPFGEIDFGYSLREEFQGRGFGTEALVATLDFCFTRLEVTSFFGEAPAENIASARVMEKAGMQRVGVSPEGRIVFRAVRSG